MRDPTPAWAQRGIEQLAFGARFARWAAAFAWLAPVAAVPAAATLPQPQQPEATAEAAAIRAHEGALNEDPLDHDPLLSPLPEHGLGVPGEGEQEHAGVPQYVFRQQVHGSTPIGIIQIGSPPVDVMMILDTGSEKCVVKTWETLRRRLKFVDGRWPEFLKPTKAIYQNALSRSYEKQWSTYHGRRHQKLGFIAYGSGIALTHDGLDLVRVGGRSLHRFPIAEVMLDSLAMLHSKTGAAGILGLQHMKNRTLGVSVFTSIRDMGKMYSFGYCRDAANDKGTFIWGDQSTEGDALDVLGEIHWAVALSDLWVPFEDEAAAHRKHAKHKRTGHADNSTATNPHPHRAHHGHSGKHHHHHHGHGHSGRHGAELHGGPGGGGNYRGGLGLDDGEGQGPPLGGDLGGLGIDPAGGPNGGGGQDVWGGGGGGKSPRRHLERRAGATKHWPFYRPEEYELPRLPLCSEEGCVAILDTGSNIIAGPALAIRALVRHVRVRYDCSNMDSLPVLHFRLGAKNVTVPPESYVMKIKLPHWASQRRLAEAEQGQRGENPWTSVFESFERENGFDIAESLEDVPREHLWPLTSLCIAAFVPLDALTAHGPLWVIGTPLFDHYYTRWSWPYDRESPEIFVHELTSAHACHNLGGGWVNWHGPISGRKYVTLEVAHNASANASNNSSHNASDHNGKNQSLSSDDGSSSFKVFSNSGSKVLSSGGGGGGGGGGGVAGSGSSSRALGLMRSEQAPGRRPATSRDEVRPATATAAVSVQQESARDAEGLDGGGAKSRSKEATPARSGSSSSISGGGGGGGSGGAAPAAPAPPTAPDLPSDVPQGNMPFEPIERDLSEIRYPFWARGLRRV